MIRRYAVMILGLTVGVLSMNAQDLQTRNLIFRNGTTSATLFAPSTGGPYTYNFPLSNGTVLMSTDPNLGTAGVMYSVSGSQDTATQGRWLFNVRYSATPTLAGATAAGGGNILAGAYLDANATGLTVSAVAGATSTARGIVANASGGASNYGIDIQTGSLKIGSLGGMLFATSGVVSAVTTIPGTVTIPAGQVTGITQYALPVGGASGLTSLSTGTAGYLLVSGGAAANPNWQSVASILGANVVVYGATAPQTALVADGANYLFNVNYSGAATGNALGAVISSDATGGTNASSTGLTVNSIATGTGVASGIVVNTGAGADLTINEDSFTRSGNIAINTGAANSVTMNGNLATSGNATLGTAGSTTGGSLTLHDNDAGTAFTGTIQGAGTYTANRVYTLPDADGTILTDASAGSTVWLLVGNSHTVTDGTNNLLGTTTANPVHIITGGTAAANRRITISATGTITLTNLAGATTGATLATDEGLVIADANGLLSKRSLANIVGSKTTAGSATGEVPVWNNTTLQYEPVAVANLSIGTTGSITSAASGSFAGDLTVGSGTSTSGGSLVFHDDNTGTSVTGSIVGAASFTSARTFTLPDASGTLAVITGTLNNNAFLYTNATGGITNSASATNGQILIGSTGSAPVAALPTGARGITIVGGAGTLTIGMPVGGSTTGSVLRFDGSNWVTTDTTYTISATGNPTIGSGLQGTAGSLTFNDGNNATSNTVTLLAPTSLASSITITLPTTSGTLLTTGNGYVNGGNSFAGNATIGLNDAFSLDIKTNNLSRIAIASGGAITVSNLSGVTTGSALVADEGLVIASATGVLSKRSIASVVGSKTLAGAADGEVAVWNNTTLQYEPVAAANLTIGTNGNITTAGTTTVGGLTTLNGGVNVGNGGAGDGLVVNTGGGADLTINEDSFTRAGDIAINTGAANTVTMNGNLSTAGNATLGTAGSTTGGSLVLHDNNTLSTFTGTLQGASEYTADRTYTLPDADGTFAVITGTLNNNAFVYTNTSGAMSTTASATDGQLLIGRTGLAPVAALPTGARGITIVGGAGTLTIGMPVGGSTTGSVLRYDGSNWVTTDTTYTISATGNPTIGSGLQGTAGSLTFNDGNNATSNTVTLLAPTSLASSITITLPTTSGTLLTTGNGYVNGGNSFGANATIGLNDNFSLDIYTNGASRIAIASGGAITLSNLSGVTTGSALVADEGLVIADANGLLSKRSIASVVGSKTVAGTANNQVPIWNNGTSQYEPVPVANYTLDASGNVLNGGTLQVNAATTLGNGDAGDLLTINTGGAANLTIAEGGLTRVGNIAINTGTGNTLSTDGNLTVAGTTTANGTVVLGSATVSATDANSAPAVTTAFLEVSITNTDGTPNSVTLPAGTNGQVLYMRLSVTNTAGLSIVTLVNSNASIIETYAQGADYQRVLHMIYVTNSSKWVVLSNVQP